MTKKRKHTKWRRYLTEVDEAAKMVTPRLKEYLAALTDEELEKALRLAMRCGSLVLLTAVIAEDIRRAKR